MVTTLPNDILARFVEFWETLLRRAVLGSGDEFPCLRDIRWWKPPERDQGLFPHYRNQVVP